MRDTNDLICKEKSDREVFKEFSDKLKKLIEENGFNLKYMFAHHLAIPYEGGFLEVYDYDRPFNPRFEDELLKFDWYLVNEVRTICIKLI